MKIQNLSKIMSFVLGLFFYSNLNAMPFKDALQLYENDDLEEREWFIRSTINASKEVYDIYEGYKTLSEINENTEKPGVEKKLNIGIPDGKEWEVLGFFQSHFSDSIATICGGKIGEAEDDDLGIIALRKAHGENLRRDPRATILIAFKGTTHENKANWVSNLSFFRIEVDKHKFTIKPKDKRPPKSEYLHSFFQGKSCNDQDGSERFCYKHCKYGPPLLHRGFTKCVLTSQEDIFQKLDAFFSKEGIQHSEVKFILTGHSLGGARAMIMGPLLLQKYYNGTNENNNVSVVTFGAPKIAHSTTRDLINEKMFADRKKTDPKYKKNAFNILEIINTKDSVPYNFGSPLGIPGISISYFQIDWQYHRLGYVMKIGEKSKFPRCFPVKGLSIDEHSMVKYEKMLLDILKEERKNKQKEVFYSHEEKVASDSIDDEDSVLEPFNQEDQGPHQSQEGMLEANLSHNALSTEPSVQTFRYRATLDISSDIAGNRFIVCKIFQQIQEPLNGDVQKRKMFDLVYPLNLPPSNRWNDLFFTPSNQRRIFGFASSCLPFLLMKYQFIGLSDALIASSTMVPCLLFNKKINPLVSSEIYKIIIITALDMIDSKLDQLNWRWLLKIVGKS